MDDKIILVERFSNFKNRIIASAFLNPIINRNTLQNEFIALPDTREVYYSQLKRLLEDLYIYQIKDKQENLLVFEDEVEEPNFPFSSVCEFKGEILNKLGNLIFIFDYGKTTYCLTQDLSHNPRKIKLEQINEVYETKVTEFNGIDEFFDACIFDGKNLKDAFRLDD